MSLPAPPGLKEQCRATTRTSEEPDDDIAIVLAIAAALTLVFAPLTTRLYRRG